jgi:hypothetical protein
VDRQLVTVQGHPPELAPPKTQASNRTIPLPRVVADALAAHLAAFPAGSDGLVFTLSGKPITRSVFGHKLRTAVKAAGLPAGTGFHALRHYYASLLIRHGESVKTVQSRLGHASAVETLDTYGHLWPDSDDRTRDAIDSVLGAESTADGNRFRLANTQFRNLGRASWPVSRILFRIMRRRPSIWTHRHRVPQAAYPQARASSPPTPARPHRGAVFLALLRVGFAEPFRSPGMLVRSYRTVSPLPPRGWRFIFCGTFPRVTSDCR